MIGLGGGGLVHLMYYLQPSLKLTAIELDPAIVQVSREHFGLNEYSTDSHNHFLDIKVGNGLKIATIPVDDNDATDTDGSVIQESNQHDNLQLDGNPENSSSAEITFPGASFSFCIIDVDSKDRTVGMSCPPKEFIDPTYLRVCSKLLQPGGILAINVSARDPKMLDQVCRNVSSVFPTVLVSTDSDQQNDLNVVVFASSHQLQSAEASDSVEPFSQEHAVKTFRDRISVSPDLDNDLMADLIESLGSLEPWKDQSPVNNNHHSRKPRKKTSKKRGKK